jgi:predicted kinase
MPTVYMLIGVPGVGKSTWIASQDWAKDCVIVSTDGHVENQASIEGKTYNEVFKDFMPFATKMMAQDVEKARELGKDIIWDQTNTSAKSRKAKLAMLPGYDAIAVMFRAPGAIEHGRRLASRPGKAIPAHIMKSMADNLQEPTEDEGFKEIWYVN